MLKNRNYPSLAPKSILLLKAHSAGIGDLLRSSAAWRALVTRYPDAALHLWFLTKNPASPSRELIARHHLLQSFEVTDKRAGEQGGWKRLWEDGRKIIRKARPELIVDFEPNGFRTSLLTFRLARWSGAHSVGIAQTPFRRWFYHSPAPSTRVYARTHSMPLPLEYAERDFVALSGLGIERNSGAIELRETEQGRDFRTQLIRELGIDANRPILGLNIGCGTPDAVGKRPDLALLSALANALQERHGFALVLTGAVYEQEINREFLNRFRPAGPVIDIAGRTSLLELTGAIAACRLFISSDSGPYHMAVGLRVPTLAVFKRPNPVHYHHHEWVSCKVATDVRSSSELLDSAESLLRVNTQSLVL